MMCRIGELGVVDFDGMATAACDSLVGHMQSDRKMVVMVLVDKSDIH